MLNSMFSPIQIFCHFRKTKIEQLVDFESIFQQNQYFRRTNRTIASTCVRTIVCARKSLIVAACPGGSGQGNKVEVDSGGAPFFEAICEVPFFENNTKSSKIRFQKKPNSSFFLNLVKICKSCSRPGGGLVFEV